MFILKLFIKVFIEKMFYDWVITTIFVSCFLSGFIEKKKWWQQEQHKCMKTWSIKWE